LHARYPARDKRIHSVVCEFRRVTRIQKLQFTHSKDKYRMAQDTQHSSCILNYCYGWESLCHELAHLRMRHAKSATCVIAHGPSATSGDFAPRAPNSRLASFPRAQDAAAAAFRDPLENTSMGPCTGAICTARRFRRIPFFFADMEIIQKRTPPDPVQAQANP